MEKLKHKPKELSGVGGRGRSSFSLGDPRSLSAFQTKQIYFLESLLHLSTQIFSLPYHPQCLKCQTWKQRQVNHMCDGLLEIIGRLGRRALWKWCHQLLSDLFFPLSRSGLRNSIWGWHGKNSKSWGSQAVGPLSSSSHSLLSPSPPSKSAPVLSSNVPNAFYESPHHFLEMTLGISHISS